MIGPYGVRLSAWEAASAASAGLLSTPTVNHEARLHHDTYAITDEAAQRRAYDERMGAFSQRNEMSQDNWTRRVIRRIGQLAATPCLPQWRRWASRCGDQSSRMPCTRINPSGTGVKPFSAALCANSQVTL
jgi:hypothetical protein